MILIVGSKKKSSALLIAGLISLLFFLKDGDGLSGLFLISGLIIFVLISSMFMKVVATNESTDFKIFNKKIWSISYANISRMELNKNLIIYSSEKKRIVPYALFGNLESLHGFIADKLKVR